MVDTRIKSFLAKLPAGPMSNHLRCWRHNRFEKNPFRMRYNAGCFILAYPDLSIRFHENPFSDLGIDGPGYFLKRSIQQGDVIIDAGAYVGALTVFMAAHAGASRTVIAFEPDPLNAARLRANITLNNLENVTIIEKGLWSHERHAPWIAPGSHIAQVSPDGKPGVYDVMLTSLDAALPPLNLPKLDFIKMDIEGAELAALEGSRTTLQAHHPNVAIASYHAHQGGVTAPYVEKQLNELGYHVETGNPRHLTTWGWY